MPDAIPDGDGEADEAAARPLPEPLLDQSEIDALAGYVPEPPGSAANARRALIEADIRPRDPLPMLSVVLDDAATRLGVTFRELLGRDASASVASIASRRYGDVVDDMVLPSQVVVFGCEGWHGSGLVAFGPDFALLLLEALLGGGPSGIAGRLAGRPFSRIESAMLSRVADGVLKGVERAFASVVAAQFRPDRSETDPRLADIARPTDLVYAASFELLLEGRTAPFLLVIPAATLEPARLTLSGEFPGVKLGRDDYWSGHFATELWQAELEAEAVLHETAIPLRQAMELGVGDTLMFDMRPTDPVEVRCGGLAVTRGRIGRVDGRIAVQITEATVRPRGPSREAA